MKNKISELIDGELGSVDADEVITELKKNNDLLNDWEAYHVISETLRQPTASFRINVSSRVSERLVSEPTLFMPRASQAHKRKFITLSAAASCAALVSGWLVMQIEDAPQGTRVAEKVNNKAVVQVDHPVTFQPSPAFTLPFMPYQPGDYLLIHREFSPHMKIQVPVTSVHQVEGREEKSR
ncbi:RseA family anti-sigma factor [Nitrosomonas sp. Is37]|uniref:RseA family anti-sigma factor n=1 Tax=Nitrosomonas sp. Is37 TaxID=3080535 RepID=UPI00294AAB4C|nr:RseA family anti-sigma factor [Nitrosomonas sp. Is37]MDV6343723.1 RseA family anti-sigma factor [Nitrosomonas sp. Is37]